MIKIGKNISSFSTYSCRPADKNELKEIINERVSKECYSCDLNDINTSLITDMSWLFYESDFNRSINNWNVSNVKSMIHMFRESKFNQDISNWKISKDCVTYNMFDKCPIKEEYKPKS